MLAKSMRVDNLHSPSFRARKRLENFQLYIKGLKITHVKRVFRGNISIFFENFQKDIEAILSGICEKAHTLS